VAIALAVTTALYLGLAVATISVLGPRAVTDVPLAALLSHAIGTVGPDAAAVAAIVLTIGAINAYISGAAAIAGQLASAVPGSRRPAPMLWLLTAIAAAGLLLITTYGLRIVAAAGLVAVPTALFLTVYLAPWPRLRDCCAAPRGWPPCRERWPSPSCWVSAAGHSRYPPLLRWPPAGGPGQPPAASAASPARPPCAGRCPGTARERQLMVSR
jgi:hypothetical protein